MKIYRLDINELADTPSTVVSSYITPRTRKNSEYFATRALAVEKQATIYEGLKNLVGFFPKVEAIITEIDVKE